MVHLEVWSDVLCPFCYIGKRHLDTALAQFDRPGQVRVVWKSFQLDPGAERTSGRGNHERLARKYGRSIEWARQMQAQVAARGAAVGIRFDFDRVIPTNSLDAHRLAHLAAACGLQEAAEDRLFAAHFTEGLSIGDPQVLRALGIEIGLDPGKVDALLAGNDYADEVRREGAEARSLGVTGVPFFLLDRKFAVSGAQPVDVFLNALRTASLL